MSDDLTADGLITPVGNTNNQERVLYQATLAANSLRPRDQYRGRLFGVSSSNGTLIFRVRVGPLGITADPQAWQSVTSAAQAANQRAGFEFMLTVRQITPSGIVQVEGLGYAHAALLPTLVSALTTAPMDITKQNFISMTVVCSSGTFTAHQGVINSV